MAFEVVLHLAPSDRMGHGQEELKVGARLSELLGGSPKSGKIVPDLRPPAAGKQAHHGPGWVEARLAQKVCFVGDRPH